MMLPDPNMAFLVSSSGSHSDPADLTLFAMQLASSDQAMVIANHLSCCAECRAELARIQSDLVLAALTVNMEAPSDSARQRLLSQVARERKSGLVTQKALEQSEPAQPRPMGSFDHPAPVLSIEGRKSKGRSRLIVLTGLGWVAAAVLCLVSGELLHDRQNLRHDLALQDGEIGRLESNAAAAHQLMDALTDPSAMRVSMRIPATPKPQNIPSGGITYNPQKGSLIFLANNLGTLEQYKTYELWIIPSDNSAPLPAGTFHPDAQGNASIVMPDLPKGVSAKAFGVTIEPEGGSQSPTMPLVLFGN